MGPKNLRQAVYLGTMGVNMHDMDYAYRIVLQYLMEKFAEELIKHQSELRTQKILENAFKAIVNEEGK